MIRVRSSLDGRRRVSHRRAHDGRPPTLCDLGRVCVVALAGVAFAISIAACGANSTTQAGNRPAKTYLIAGAGSELISKPANFCVSADGSSCVSRVRWSGWGDRIATGYGTYTRETCKPNCASGPTLSYSVTLRAAGRHTCQGKPTYTELDGWTKHKLADGAIETTTLLPSTPDKCPLPPLKAEKSRERQTEKASEYNKPIATETCELYRSGSNVRLQFFGADAGQQACEEVAQDFSGESGYWIAATPPTPDEPLRQICALQSPKDDHAIIVQDSGSAFYGTRICGDLAKAGWTLDHEILHDEEEASQHKEAAAAKEREEAERIEAAAAKAQSAREAKEHQEEERRLRAENETQKREESKQRAEEAKERHAEAEEQHNEEAQQHRELDEENRRIKEEARQIERES